MAQLQENIKGIVATFYVCGRSDGDCSPLSREELRLLIEQEFADAMENPQDPKTVKKVLCFLDNDSNCRVGFSELLSLVFRVAKACYKPLQPRWAPEDGQEPTVQEKADEEQPPEPRAAGRVSHSQQVPKQGVNNQVQDTETRDPDTRETQEGDTGEQDPDTRETQEGDTGEQDPDTRETQEGDTGEQDPDTQEQDPDTHQDDRTEAPEGDPKKGEILDAETPGQDRNSHKAEETETSKQDPKTCEAPQQNLNPGKTQKLLPLQRGASPRRDPKPQGTCHDPAFHHLPEPKVPEQHSRVEAPSCPTQQQDAHGQRKPAMEQQLLQSLYQWPPQQ
ncbi:CRNN protein, partial [Podilymbus podiceps]|nr:CRNN protein [Podilymbus podiceps]